MKIGIEEYNEVFADDEIEVISKKMNTAAWSFSNYGRPNSHRRFWSMELINDPFFSVRLFDKIQSRIMAQCKLNRVFANGQTYGQDGDWHQDKQEKDCYTFVYYVNQNWKIDWGGETDFFVDTGIHSFLPVANKGILFPAYFTHRGLAPSRDCYELRITIAFHFNVLQWFR